MEGRRRRRRAHAAILALALGPAALGAQMPGPAGDPIRHAGPSAAATVDSLALGTVLAGVKERNPRLLALTAAAEAAAYREPDASTLPDPMLQLGVMNFGLPHFNADMPTSMAPSIQVMQTIPFPGKLSLAGDVASHGREIAEAGADEAWWEVRERAASIFYDLYALDRRLEVMRGTLALLREFQQVANAMYVSGTGRQADVLRADVEVARMDGDIRRMEAMRTTAAARLNALLDHPADTPVPTPALGSLPADVPDAGTLRSWARETRPALEGGRLEVARAETGSALAHRGIWPDLTFGFAYGQRDRGLGTERMGSAMVGLSLPVHARSRQLAARDEAAAMERLAAAELDGREADVDARIGELLAELDQARTLAALYRDEVIPEARATVASAFSSYRVGNVDFMTLVDAQMAANRYEGELYQLLADQGTAVAGLESAVGRPLPRAGAPMVEER